MNQELKNNLCSYLGELMDEAEDEHYWYAKELILQKIDAINLLLGTPPITKRVTYMERLMEAVKNVKP